MRDYMVMLLDVQVAAKPTTRDFRVSNPEKLVLPEVVMLFSKLSFHIAVSPR